MLQLAKQLVGQWTGYDAPLLNHALEIVLSADPQLELTPLSTGLHLAVLGPATPDMSTVLRTLPKSGAVVAPVGAKLSAYQVPHISYEVLRLTPLESGGFAVQARIHHHDIDISLPRLIRASQAQSVLAALALAQYRQLDLADVIQALADIAPVAGHGFIHQGINYSRIYDESMQANPEDMHDALDTLAAVKGERKIAVLSNYPEVVHKAGQVASLVLLVGKHMRVAQHEAFLAGADVHCFDTAQEVSPWLTSFITPGDVILIKGRKEAGLEKLVEKLVG